jgi:acyl-CoA synthetase (AMP-forming)/AMP-acid ligase II
VLADCPDIAECAVIGAEDPKWGESAVACIVLRAESRLTENAIKSLFNDRLAKFKHPRRVIFLDSLPKNAMGKVQKFELKQKLKELS